jgi:hypothetical protein
MGVPTAVLMLLEGNFAGVPVTTEAFQPPPGSGSVSGAFLVAEHAVSAYLVNSISLPELSRRIPATPLWYDFTSETIKGVSPVDGGFYLPPGFESQSVSLNYADDRIDVDLRWSDDDFGHILPVPAGETVQARIFSIDGTHVAWSGELRCTSQSSADLPPSLSLKELRAIVKFERGGARVLIPESSMSMGVSLLSLFMTIFYLLVISERLYGLGDDMTASDLKQADASGTRLFLMNGPTNASSSAIGGLIVSSSAIQTFRESVVLAFGLAAFAVAYLALFQPLGIKLFGSLPMSTLRVIVEGSLLSAIALPMGVYSKLSQFTSALVGIAVVGIALRRWSPRLYSEENRVAWLVDTGFRLAAIGVLAPTIIFPVLVTSSVEYRGSMFLIYPTISFTIMLAATLAHTQTGRTIAAEPRGEGRDQDRSRHTLIVLFLALTILVKPLVVGETLPVN